MPRLLGPVFLSHSSKDKGFVNTLRRDLEDRGFRPWMDAHDLYGGDALPKHIAEGLAKASAVLIVLTTDALRSRWLSYELQIAVHRMVEAGILVIPARLGDIGVPPELAGLVYADFRDGEYDRGLATVISALEQREAREAESDWPLSQLEGLLDEVFDERAVLLSDKEYGPPGYDVVGIDLRDDGDHKAFIVYEIEGAYSANGRPLSRHYWAEYKEILDERRMRYSLLIAERPVEFELPPLEGTNGQVGLYEKGGGQEQPLALVLDISGDIEREEQRACLLRVREFVSAREAARSSAN